MSKKIGINEALKCFGGEVRHFDTTEPLPQLIAFISNGNYKNVLACCGGGDQALTILSASKKISTLWAVDIKPSQLFILAAKADFLQNKKSKPYMPFFEELYKVHSTKISVAKMKTCSLRYFLQLSSGKKVPAPKGFNEKYAAIIDDGMFIQKESGPFWKNDRTFIERIRSRLNCLQFLNMDIFDCPQHLKSGSLDLIYLSNIPAHNISEGTVLKFYWDKMLGLLKLLRPGGKIITYDHHDGNIYPADIFLKRVPHLVVEIENKMNYRVLQPTDIALRGALQPI